MKKTPLRLDTALEQMDKIRRKSGVQPAGIFAHRLSEPIRMSCLKQLRLDSEMEHTIGEVQWVQGVIDGRIR